jgi:methyl-accepting chemotaxis protein
MQWVRNVSLVQRVVGGFGAMAVMMGAIGGSAAWNAPTPSLAWVFGGATAAGCLSALVAAWLIRASIKESVESTVHCVVRIASGDLESKIDSPGKDEISWLRAELNGMRKKLRTAVLAVRETVDGVNCASDEIASGNTDLSARTESQASALQETAAAIRQLADSVRSNAQSTREARQVVAQSSEVATRGARMMDQMVARMGEVNVSSRKITEIIGVIDGIAFQTNILALNAAVEAARAGEHGRGFAVVASEVRGLAQRSATAAREIKALIDVSSERVDSGTRLVDEAGRTMKEILDSVNQVTAHIACIADAGQSQSTDLGHVHQAVTQIDDMTQRNATLVQQLAASAQALKGQSAQLNESMASFHVVPA